MGDLIWLNDSCFESDRAYEAYLKAERAVAKEPLYLEFDWRLLIQILLGRTL